MSAARPTPFAVAPDLVRKGYRVFACGERSKVPLKGSAGFKDSTDDVGLAEGIAEATPTRNVAIDCGGSGVAAFDIDSKAGVDPDELIAELEFTEDELKCLVETGTARAPSKKHPKSLEGVRGKQVWFRGQISSGHTSIEGTEIKSVGGYVMAPPSIHPHGDVYEGEIPPVEDLPPLPDRIAAARAEAEAATPRSRDGKLPPLPDRIPAGARHKTFNDYALSLRRKGFSEAGIAAALKAENGRCGEDPDNPEPLPDEEIEAIARDKARRFAPSTPETDRTDRTPPEKPHGEADSSVRSPTERPPDHRPNDRPDLALDPSILDRFDEVMEALGLVGERATAQGVRLVHVSRLLEEPARTVVKGDSSSGKSYATKCALETAAPEELFIRTQTSPLALFYSERDFRHITIVFYEANKLGDDDDPLASVVRTLLSEGRLAYEVTDPKTHSTKYLEQEGPVALVTTTTKASLDKEIETRILSMHSNSSDAQTQAVVASILKGAADSPPELDLAEWHALDRWLRKPPREVVVPWAPALATFNLSGPPRLRRDIANLLALVRSHALLHRANRETDDRDRVIATLDDYGVVSGLLAEAMAVATDKAVRKGTREIVGAVESLRKEGKDKISLRAASRAAGRSYSTTHTDVHDALDRGYLVNRSSVPDRYDLDVGDPLPDPGELLPTREELEERVRHRSGGRSVPHRTPQTRSQSQESGGVRSDRLISEVEGDPPERTAVLEQMRAMGITPKDPDRGKR